MTGARRASADLSFQLSIEIKRPPAIVFATLADIQDVEPVPRRATVRMVKDPAGPTRTGTRWHEDVRFAPGYWLHIESVVTEVEQPGSLGMDFSTVWFTGHLTYTIEPTPDGSLLHQWETLRPRLLCRWLGPVIDRQLRPRLDQRLRDLKAILESHAITDPAPPVGGP